METIIDGLKEKIVDASINGFDDNLKTDLKGLFDKLRSYENRGAGESINIIDKLEEKFKLFDEKMNKIMETKQEIIEQKIPIIKKIKFTGNSKDKLTMNDLKQLLLENNCKYDKHCGINRTERGFQGVKLDADTK